MYDSIAQQLLPIEAAILEALNMVPSASEALDMLIDNLEPSGARIAYRFGSRLREDIVTSKCLICGRRVSAFVSITWEPMRMSLECLQCDAQ